MSKKLVFMMIIFSLAISQFVFGGGNKAYKNTKLGVQFQYTHNYKVSITPKKGYHEIKLESTDKKGGIIIQKFHMTLNKKVEKVYINAVMKTLISKGFKKISHRHKEVTLPIKKLYKSPATKAHEHIMVFKSPKEVTLKMTIYIFNGGLGSKKGFAISFIEAGTKKRSSEFDVFKKSLTLLS